MKKIESIIRTSKFEEVTEEEEIEGLDVGEHKMYAYPDINEPTEKAYV